MPESITLEEYTRTEVSKRILTRQMAQTIKDSYSRMIDIQTSWDGKSWELTSNGHVGFIPLSDEVHLILKPRIPVMNIFRMLEYAYRVDLFKQGLTGWSRWMRFTSTSRFCSRRR